MYEEVAYAVTLGLERLIYIESDAEGAAVI
jgi:hypothetical protein